MNAESLAEAVHHYKWSQILNPFILRSFLHQTNKITTTKMSKYEEADSPFSSTCFRGIFLSRCLTKDQVKFFKGCLSQILLGPFLYTLAQLAPGAPNYFGKKTSSYMFGRLLNMPLRFWFTINCSGSTNYCPDFR